MGIRWAQSGHKVGHKVGTKLGTKWARSWVQSGHKVRHKVGTKLGTKGFRWVGVIILTGKPFIGGDLHTLPLLPKSEFTLS